MTRDVSAVATLIIVALAAARNPIIAQSRGSDAHPPPLSAAIHDNLQWRPCINTSLRGCEIHVIRGVLENGPSEVFIRFAPRAVVPRFRHSVNERGLLLEGELLGTNERGIQTTVEPGTYWYIGAGTIHGGLRCGDERPCLIYESYDGTFDVDIVAEPSSAKQTTVAEPNTALHNGRIGSPIIAPALDSSLSPHVAAMHSLSMLDGEWKGDGWTIGGPSEKITFNQTIRVMPAGFGALKIIDGRSSRADGTVTLTNYEIISYDAEKKSYSLRLYSQGKSADVPITPNSAGFTLQYPAGDATIRFTITVVDNVWREIAERLQTGEPPVRFLELNLRRVGAPAPGLE